MYQKSRTLLFLICFCIQMLKSFFTFFFLQLSGGNQTRQNYFSFFQTPFSRRDLREGIWKFYPDQGQASMYKNTPIVIWRRDSKIVELLLSSRLQQYLHQLTTPAQLGRYYLLRQYSRAVQDYCKSETARCTRRYYRDDIVKTLELSCPGQHYRIAFSKIISSNRTF